MLWTVLNICALALCAAILIPTAMFFLEVLANVISRGRLDPIAAKNVRVAVVVPAHNESIGLIPTLSDVRAQLFSEDRLLVVADNCTDDTATVARHAGAEVVERDDLQRVGKGYALDFGVRSLSGGLPEILIIIDADCRVAPGTIAELATIAESKQRPVQALYLMTAPTPASVIQRASEFAWRIKNQIRPTGLHAMNLPCQLMGTGMALPWSLIQGSNLATGEIVEDLDLGLRLAARGYPPVFCPQALVTSTFPTSAKGIDSQRSRWEQGHVRLLMSVGPHLALASIKQGNLRLLAQALDLMIPPLGLLLFLNIATVGVTGLLWLLSVAQYAFALSGFSLALMSASIIICWLLQGRTLLPVSDLPSAFGYLVSKVGLYRKLMAGRGVASWVRTDRGDQGAPKL